MLKIIRKLIDKLKGNDKKETGFTPVSLPLIRQSYPELMANKIVGVQPMKTPIGLVYLRMNYNRSYVNFNTVRIDKVLLKEWIKYYWFTF